MDTKLDSRQGQFPASFPDTFKDFFAMMSEDEDHLDLFSNLLEDKVIPRTHKFNQRRCGGSLRCNNSNSSNGATNAIVGRSNSFRVNRPASSYCKHIKYCCLHQQQQHYSQNVQDYQRRSGGDGCSNEEDEMQSNSGGQQHKSASARQAIIERSFECESCDDSDTISTSSSTPAIPYSTLPLRNAGGSGPGQGPTPGHHHNPHPHPHHNQPKGFHGKDKMPRVVQQCGLRADNTTRANVSAALGGGFGSSSNLTGGSGNTSNGTTTSMGSNCTGGAKMAFGVTSGAIAGGKSEVSRSASTLYMDSALSSSQVAVNKLNICQPSRPTNIRSQKSPVLNRRRSSSIAATLLTTDNKIYRNTEDAMTSWNHSTIPHSSTRERLSHVKSPVSTKGKSSTIVAESGVLTFKQAMSGAVSPQYSATSPSHLMGSTHAMMSAFATGANGGGCVTSPTSSTARADGMDGGGGGVGGGFSGSAATIGQLGGKQRQRLRTSSMPAESRKPRLADTRRAAIHCADVDMEYYRLRSFSITSHGVCNLGDSLRSRRSRSINSVTSTGTSNSGRDRHNSNSSRTSCDNNVEVVKKAPTTSMASYKIAMLGASGVGKTALTYQFTTSDYICAYDLSLDDDYGQKTVSVLVDGIENDLEIIDHPACEMSTEAFCSTYNVDLFVVVYSVEDRNSFKSSEKVLHYLKDNEMLLTRGAILVGNKTDLERHREVNRQAGRKLAKEIACKFIETSSGLDHNVDELLVGIVAQAKLNPQRISKLSEKDRQRLNLHNTLQKHRRFDVPQKRIVKQMSVCKETPPAPSTPDTETTTTTTSPSVVNKTGPVKKNSRRVLNLESILKMGESDDDDGYRPELAKRTDAVTTKTRVERKPKPSSSPKTRNSYERRETTAQEEMAVSEPNPADSGCKRAGSKLTNRTKIFLTSVLRFKKALNVKRRNSSSCSDLFVI